MNTPGRWGSWTAAVMAVALGSPGAGAQTEPWSDSDGLGKPSRRAFGSTGVSLGAEYRANWLYANPVDLNGVKHRRASWIEHRLRLDGAVDYNEKVRVVVSLDALDGTLWGDNGTFGTPPSPNTGIRAAATNPNNAKPKVGYVGGDELDPDSYGYTLVESEPVKVRRAYGEVATPFGLLRIGRQPAVIGTSLMVADGDHRANRFGYANAGDSADRILFATKPLEALKPEAQRDTSLNRGLFLIAFYDRVASEQVRRFGDDLQAAVGVVRWLSAPPDERDSFELQGVYGHRWEQDFDTNINLIQGRAIARLSKLQVGVEGIAILGGTREISDALSLINNDPVVRQTVQQFAARGVARWDEPMWTAYLEVDFATGDRNPNPGTDLTQLYWGEDTNVGLLMFERVLAFETARTSAAGVELLKRIGAKTFPAERVDSEGSFTSAIAFFPQFDVRPIPDITLRGGVLTAWSPAGLVDPIESLKQRDGTEIEDDLVNFNGGRPGHFYGVELDGRFSWRYLEHFIFDLEGAVLFPGDVFHDENEQAARSVLVQGRTTFVF